MISLVKGAIGIVQSIDPVNYTASVQLKEYENVITKQLQILAPVTLANKITCIPKVGTSVLVLFVGDNADNGFIIGSYYSKKNKANEKQDEFKINYQGATLTIAENGNVDITASKTTIMSNTEIIGDLTVTKNATVAQKLLTKDFSATGGAESKILKAESIKYKTIGEY